MLKRMSIKKILVATLSLFTLLLIYLMPTTKYNNKIISTSKIEYEQKLYLSPIYLLDQNDYVVRTKIKTCDCNNAKIASILVNALIKNSEQKDILPGNFEAIIPEGTKILNLVLENNTITIDFSSEIKNIAEKNEEKMLSAIIYTLLSIDNIDKVIIKVEGNLLTELPKSKKKIPLILDKTFGINKTYDLISTNNIDTVVVYYVSHMDDFIYYVPVTKYINNQSKDKIKVIIEQLATSPIYETNLMSYLNSDISLIDYQKNGDNMVLNFNDALLSDDSNNQILEEVIYTIGLSVLDNYNVEKVSFLVNNKEIYKNFEKKLEY